MAAKKRPNKISAADRAFNKQAREYQKKYDARKAAAKKAGAKKTYTFTDDEYRKFFKQEREGGIPKATIEKLKQRTEAEKQREYRIRKKWLDSQARAGTGPFAKKKTTAKKASTKKTAARRTSSSGSTNITMDDVRAYRAKVKAKNASAKKAKSMSQKQARRK